MIDKALLTEIKKVSLPHVLSDLGIAPAGKRGYEGRSHLLYSAPYRADNHPSLAVFQKPNGQWLFKDHASGEVGTNLDLLVLMNVCQNWQDAASYIALRYLGISLHGQSPITSHAKIMSPAVNVPTMYTRPATVLSVSSVIGSPAEQYVVETRGIPKGIANKYLYFIVYNYPERPHHKALYGIAWPTINGGWSIRWAADVMKGGGKNFIGHAGPSLFKVQDSSNTPTCTVFEGVFDFLSFIADTGIQVNDAIVLNSTSNVSMSLPLLESYASLDCFFDHDSAGDEALKTVKKHHQNVHDLSHIYNGYNDYNDYFINKHTNVKPR